jgi:hypothetical protein
MTNSVASIRVILLPIVGVIDLHPSNKAANRLNHRLCIKNAELSHGPNRRGLIEAFGMKSKPNKSLELSP